MDHHPSYLSGHKRDLFVLVVAAVAVRVIWLWLGSWTANDSADYLAIGANLLDHGSFSLSDGGTSPTAFRPPLFPFVIAFIWVLAGKSVTAILIGNIIFGSATVGLTYLIAHRSFDRMTALLAAGALAVAPMTALFAVTPLTESLFTFLAVLAIFLWGEKKYVLAGSIFGLAALARPTIIPFFALITLLPILPPWRPLWRTHLVMVLAALGVVGIWTVRNVTVLDRFALVSSAGIGVNLLCGTLETDTGGNVWNGSEWGPLDLKTNPVTRVDGVSDEFEVDKIRRDRALSRIITEPGQWMVARLKQFPKLFVDNGDYLLGTANLPLRQAFSNGVWGVAAFKLAFITVNLLIFALAIFGFWRMGPQIVLSTHIWMFPLFGVLIHLPMWIEPRYFLPMMPMVFIMAAYATSTILSKSSVLNK